jgi:hypothetical protein
VQTVAFGSFFAVLRNTILGLPNQSSACSNFAIGATYMQQEAVPTRTWVIRELQEAVGPVTQQNQGKLQVPSKMIMSRLVAWRGVMTGYAQ